MINELGLWPQWLHLCGWLCGVGPTMKSTLYVPGSDPLVVAMREACWFILILIIIMILVCGCTIVKIFRTVYSGLTAEVLDFCIDSSILYSRREADVIFSCLTTAICIMYFNLVGDVFYCSIKIVCRNGRCSNAIMNHSSLFLLVTIALFIIL